MTGSDSNNSRPASSPPSWCPTSPPEKDHIPDGRGNHGQSGSCRATYLSEQAVFGDRPGLSAQWLSLLGCWRDFPTLLDVLQQVQEDLFGDHSDAKLPGLVGLT